MMLQLDWSDLILSHAWIDNRKTGSSDGLGFTVEDPTDGTMPDCGQAEAEAAVDAAYRSFSCLRGMLAKEPAQYLQSWLPAIRKHAEDLTRLISLEQGNRWARAGLKSLTARPTSSSLPRRQSGFTEIVIPEPAHGRRIIATKEPVGVAAAITSWNLPIATCRTVQ